MEYFISKMRSIWAHVTVHFSNFNRKRQRPKLLRAILSRLKSGNGCMDLGGPTEGLEGLSEIFQPFLLVNSDWEQDKMMKPELWKKQNIQWVRGDGCNLPFQDKSVDYIISNNIIEHIPKENWPKYASEIIRVARKGYFIEA